MLNQHKCLLQTNPVDILSQVIESGIFINFRRRLLRLTMISDNHPYTSIYYKSNSAKINEEVRHLANYRFIIHPFSMFALYWELVYFNLFIFSLMVLSMTAARRIAEISSFVIYSKICTDIILTGDIVKIFFTGYYDAEQSKSILHPAKIAKKYLTSYFVPDVLALIHSYFLIMKIILDFPYTLSIRIIVISLRLLFSLRIVRLSRWLDALEFFHVYFNLSSFMNRALRAVLIFIIILFWLYSMIFQIEMSLDRYFLEESKGRWNDNKSKYFFSATLRLLHVSYGDKPTEYIYQILVSVVFMGIGYCLQLFLFTQIIQVWVKFSNAKNKNESLFQQFSEYLKYKDLPMSLRKKFFSFYQFRFQNQFYNETHINKTVSKILKQEILVFVTKNHVQRVEFFMDLPDNVLSKLVSRLKSEIYLANDTILVAGVPGNCMYFIYFGTVAIYSPSGREICHLEDGAHFGEIALIFNEPRVATVKAVTPCELFILNRSDFLEVLEPYPDIKDKITLLAEERLRSTGFLRMQLVADE